jgi:hypothetical protein
MTREITIRVCVVSDELTRVASAMILKEFGGFFAVNGAGAYKLENGKTGIERVISWHIGTSAKDSTRFEFVSRFAVEYCKAGKQESIYFLDTDGLAYLAYAGGQIAPLD